MQTFILRVTACIFVGLFITSAFAQQKLPVMKITAGMYLIQAEVAATEAQREIGLMNRKQMGQNEGMLFKFDRPAGYCMWMKNTLIPLSVAFLNGDGIILNIEEMQPQSEKTHCATKPALYALEMNAGWFKRKNIKPGSKVELLK
jgi:uncharacterized membrane protein (UPF0127 family)